MPCTCEGAGDDEKDSDGKCEKMCDVSFAVFGIKTESDGTFTLFVDSVSDSEQKVVAEKTNIQRIIRCRGEEIANLYDDAKEAMKRIAESIGTEIGQQRTIDLDAVDEMAIINKKIANHEAEIANLQQIYIATRQSVANLRLGEKSQPIQHPDDPWKNNRTVRFTVVPFLAY